MTCLKLPGRRVTINPGEIRNHAVNFYADLFRAEQCSMVCPEELLEGLPQLSEEKKTVLDREFSLGKQTAAVEQLVPGKAPGLMFLETFWENF